ncbi:lipocalin-like domain-containing protein [Candidatus Njordibacter sp. Uisw_056]|uniref:lipocalin-like domain-containing protein n=1 Tax=Candidatus Njordibacter sp. Uisw_056 TaxID=3230973 RepID=UPI003D52EB3D
MAKLNKKIVSLSLAGVFLLGTYFVVTSQIALKTQANMSVFGRNVYEQNDDFNNALASNMGKKADPNYRMSFPQDHGTHDQFDIEWWYLTANLQDEAGDPYGLQWTLFRFKNPRPRSSQTEGSNSSSSLKNSPVTLNESTVSLDKKWHNDQIYMAHASIHSLDTHWFSEKFARGGVGNAGLTALPLNLFIDDWQWLNSDGDTGLFPSTLTFSATDTSKPNAEASATFTLNQTGPLVQHGDNGFSVKSNSGHASHYYSAPFISIEGELTQAIDTVTAAPIKLKGQAWFDKEWTSQLLDTGTQGWDWLSLHLDDGNKIMAFRMRLKNQDDHVTGSYITSNGEQITLQPGDLTLQPVSVKKVDGRQLPLIWKLIIPSKKIDLTISTLKDKQWNNAAVPYYEGMVKIEGSHGGVGFLELTGY